MHNLCIVALLQIDFFSKMSDTINTSGMKFQRSLHKCATWCQMVKMQLDDFTI